MRAEYQKAAGKVDLTRELPERQVGEVPEWLKSDAEDDQLVVRFPEIQDCPLGDELAKALTRPGAPREDLDAQKIRVRASTDQDDPDTRGEWSALWTVPPALTEDAGFTAMIVVHAATWDRAQQEGDLGTLCKMLDYSLAQMSPKGGKLKRPSTIDLAGYVSVWGPSSVATRALVDAALEWSASQDDLVEPEPQELPSEEEDKPKARKLRAAS